MAYLRSPFVHHLGLEPNSLRDFAYHYGRERNIENRDLFLGQYSRPSLPLFQSHLRQVLADGELPSIHVRDRVRRLRRVSGGWLLETNASALRARNVVLCLGLSEQLAWPDWAKAASASGAAIQHVLGDTYCDPPADARVVVIGGGITAAQLAIKLARQTLGGPHHAPSADAGNDFPRQARVTLLTRHPLRVHEFDANPGWMGPKFLAGFHQEPSWPRRRELIQMARQRGTVPSEVHQELTAMEQRGSLSVRKDEIVQVMPPPHSKGLRCQTHSHALSAHHIVLCTGYQAARPGGELVDDLVSSMDLPVAPCGYPVLPETLEWCQGLFVSGPLAELELGPVSRNILGARMAAGRMLRATRRRNPQPQPRVA